MGLDRLADAAASSVHDIEGDVYAMLRQMLSDALHQIAWC
jgi:hypothetical protein